jgi:hypothetical protein
MKDVRRLAKLIFGFVLAGGGLFILLYAVATPLYLATIEGALVALVGLFFAFLALVVLLTGTRKAQRLGGDLAEEGELPERPIQPTTDATLDARRAYAGVTMGMAPTYIDPRMRDEPLNKRRD